MTESAKLWNEFKKTSKGRGYVTLEEIGRICSIPPEEIQKAIKTPKQQYHERVEKCSGDTLSIKQIAYCIQASISKVQKDIDANRLQGFTRKGPAGTKCAIEFPKNEVHRYINKFEEDTPTQRSLFPEYN